MRSLPPLMASSWVYRSSSQYQSRPARIKAVLNARRWTVSVSANVPSTSKISALSMLGLPVVCRLIMSGAGLGIGGRHLGKHPAGPNVLGADRLQGGVADIVGIAHQSGRMAQAGAFQGIAYAAGISKIRLLHALDNVLRECLLRRLVKAILHAFKHDVCNFFQLFGRVIGKIDMMGN